MISLRNEHYQIGITELICAKKKMCDLFYADVLKGSKSGFIKEVV